MDPLSSWTLCPCGPFVHVDWMSWGLDIQARADLLAQNLVLVGVNQLAGLFEVGLEISIGHRTDFD